MKFIIHKLPALVFFSVFLAACQPSSAPKIVSSVNMQTGINRALPPAQPPPNTANIEKFGWKLQSGTKQTLADYKGKVVVLDFWATYCPPCLEEIPHLVSLQDKFKGDGLRVIGLHVGGPDDRPFVADFVTKLKIQYDLGEPEAELVDALFNGTDVIPQTFIFDRNGKLVENFSSYDAAVREELDRAVQRALASAVSNK
ncbi:MAG TPA: TlpA disulfide reductase family protein [Pyrinomonadaceae bacterium]|jgi:thiol-disulfide isomerase/thioredoxin|nr:TlpA disulfide reductase family protein [Pyrinomonadaceae bacterium]